MVFLDALKNCERYLLASPCLRVLLSLCTSVRMEQIGYHWVDVHEIWYLSIRRKTAKKIQVSLISDKNNGYLTWEPVDIYDNISLCSSYNKKIFQTEVV